MATQTDDWGSTPYEGDSAEPNFSLDTSELSVDDLSRNNFVDKVGWYHLEVTDMTYEGPVSKKGAEQTPHVRVHLTVLHTVVDAKTGRPIQSPAGSLHFHRCYVGQKGGGDAKEGSVKSNSSFLYAAKSLVPSATLMHDDGTAKLVDAATGKPNVTWDTFVRCRGRQIVGKISMQQGELKDKNPKADPSGPRYPDKYELRSFYSPDDPNAADIEKDAEALKLAGYDLSKCGKVSGQPLQGSKSSGANGNGNGNGAQSAGPKPQNVTTAGPDLDDL